MYLQGDLQTVFDALYHLGVIDPVLDMDWTKELSEIDQYWNEVSAIVGVANSFQNDVEKLKFELKKFDQKTLGYLAMEVAREYADFHARQNLQ